MIISDEKKFIFFHIPKCAGTSIRSVLKAYDSTDSYYWGSRYLEKLNRLVDMAHITYEIATKILKHETLEKYFKFCFVREPYDRLYSAFLEHKAHNPDKHILEENFNLYMQKNLNEENIHNNIRYVHFTPMYYYTHYKQNRAVDFIGTIENLKQDFQAISKRINLKNIKLEHKNVKGDNKIHTENWTYKYLDKFEAKTINLINKLYAKDFEYFNYKMLDPKNFKELYKPC